MLSLCKRLLFVSFLLINPFISDSSLYAKRTIGHVVTPIDQVVGEGQAQLTKVRICFTSIAALIKKNQTYSAEQIEKISKHFIDLDRILMANLQNEKFIHADLENAYTLLQINNTLIDHINHLMNTNFKDLDSFNMEDFIKNATTTRGILQPEEILDRLLSNNKKIDVLTKRALGLTWFNKVSRVIDDYIITPCQKYSIPERTALSALVVFLASYFAWQLAHERFKQAMEGDDDPNCFQKHVTEPLFRNIYGPLPEKNNSNREELALLGQIDLLAYKWTHGLTKTGAVIAGIVSAWLLIEGKQNLYPKLKKQFEVAKNWLKGGSYLKEAERAAEKVEHVRFNDIFGQDEIKRYLQLIVDYLENPETFDRLGLTPPKGILCIGDTRTGKTFMINALFGEINDMLKRTNQTGKFKLIKLDVLSIKVDGMETILRRVRQNAPCIVFIDEIDLLDLQRTGENRTLSEFLTAMGEAMGSKDSKKHVIVFAATNRPETLDVALRQPGRFGKELRFEYPNFVDRYKFIQSRLLELSLTSDQFDITKLAQFIENKSYEALNMFIKNGIIKARLRNEVLMQDHLDEALDEDIYHIIPKYTKNIPHEELKVLAAHFAGQALTLALFDSNINLAKVTIKQVMTELKEEVMGMHLYTDKHKKEQQRFEYGRIFMYHKSDSINMNTREEKLALCKMYLAGFIAEELLLGSCGYSCHADDDTANALGLAQSIAFEGIDITTMPKHIQKQKHDHALVIIEECKQAARELLTTHKATLQALTDTLLEQKTLDRDQIAAVIKDQKELITAPAIPQVAAAA